MKSFFEGPPSTSLERFENYSLEEQYQIFVYGMQVAHPPAMRFSRPIAKRGQAAADYVLQQLSAPQSNDFDYRDSMLIFQDMQRRGYFDICAHSSYLEKIRDNAMKIEDEGQKESYLRDVEEMGCTSPSKG